MGIPDSSEGQVDEIEKIVAGDIVRLKSGGPHMTVKSINEEKQFVDCIWFRGYDDSVCCAGQYFMVTIEKVS